MKFFLLMILVVVLSLGITACSQNKSPVDEAKEVVENYMDTLYNIEDFTVYKNSDPVIEIEKVLEIEEKLKPYITQDMLSSLRGDRELFFIIWAAKTRQTNIALDQIDLELKSNEENEIYFSYVAILKLTSINGKEEYKKKEGQIKLSKLNDEWKIGTHKAFTYPLTTKIDYYNIKTKNIKDMILSTTKNNIYSELKAYVNKLFFAVHNTSDDNITLKSPSSSEPYTLILYKNDKEVWRTNIPESNISEDFIIDVIEKGESMVFSIKYPIGIDSGEYEYEFYLNAEGWENKEHLKGIVNIEK